MCVCGKYTLSATLPCFALSQAPPPPTGPANNNDSNNSSNNSKKKPLQRLFERNKIADERNDETGGSCSAVGGGIQGKGKGEAWKRAWKKRERSQISIQHLAAALLGARFTEPLHGPPRESPIAGPTPPPLVNNEKDISDQISI